MTRERNSILYTLIEGDVLLSSGQYEKITDGEVWIYADGSRHDSGTITEPINRSEAIRLKLQGGTIFNLDEIETVD